MKAMNAVVYTKYGSPDVLQLKEVEKPIPKDNEVLIKVHAASINSWDRVMLTGRPLENRLLSGILRPTKTKILGCDIAGRIEAVARNIKQFHPGDDVFGDLCEGFWGGFAEYVCACESELTPKPTWMTYEEAAATSQAGLLALHGFCDKREIRPGQRILINGAGGGVGTFAIQMAKSHELTNRRYDEKTISYAESHGQALVGDQTLIFRLLGDRMYTHMSMFAEDLVVSRGIALHKMIRLAALATAGYGYLNFMGNELGHPEWIDFPREGNKWSHIYVRRQGHLVDECHLRYRHLGVFDRDMIRSASEKRFPDGGDVYLLHSDDDNKVLAFSRNEIVFIFNFHPRRSYNDYRIPAAPGSYLIILDTDYEIYGGFSRQDLSMIHETITDRIHRHYPSPYLPGRAAILLERQNVSIKLPSPQPLEKR